MNFLIYSSPYQYYFDNLSAISDRLKLQHDVYSSYKIGLDSNEVDYFSKKDVKYSEKFLNNKLKVDCCILTQPWWYQDSLIAKKAKEDKIPLFIIDHAPPMMRYTQADGKKSHLYRSDSSSGVYLSYGKKTVDIMKQVGFRNKNIAIGSTRIEDLIKDKKNKDGFVIFDTSNKMDDKNLVNDVEKFILRRSDINFLIKEHSRSPKYYRRLLNYSNVSLANDISESELLNYSDFGFTFPSSAMIAPALLNKNIYTFYKKHFCLEAKEYYSKYNKVFSDFKNIGNKKYDIFIKENLTYNKSEPAVERIYKYIMESL